MLMNSFSTSADTMEFLQQNYPALAKEEGLEMLQNKVPKLDATTLQPATCASNPDNEWCPPGHGDLYVGRASEATSRSNTRRGNHEAFSNTP